jgi:hypothetical protein
MRFILQILALITAGALFVACIVVVLDLNVGKPLNLDLCDVRQIYHCNDYPNGNMGVALACTRVVGNKYQHYTVTVNTMMYNCSILNDKPKIRDLCCDDSDTPPREYKFLPSSEKTLAVAHQDYVARAVFVLVVGFAAMCIIIAYIALAIRDRGDDLQIPLVKR